MSRAIVVGYTATKRGKDAVAFGARLAKAIGGELHIAMVLPNDHASVITPPDASYERYLESQAKKWLTKAATKVSEAVPTHTHVQLAESYAEGLIEVAHITDAEAIVIGAANGGLVGRLSLGTTGDELLHTADVPVVLVPQGARKIAVDSQITRVTAAVGVRPGASALLEEATNLAALLNVPLRLLSLVTVDLPDKVDAKELRRDAAKLSAAVLAATKESLPDHLSVEILSAQGNSIEEAASLIDWQPGELLIAGSSRLAQPRRLFLGSTAARMLRELPVPMVVVPRTANAATDTDEETE